MSHISISRAPARALSSLAAARRALPRGQTLPPEAWRRRHRGIVAVLWSQVVILAVLAIALDVPPLHALQHDVPVVVLAGLASWPRLGRRLRSCLSSAGLLLASVLAVHTTGGVTEAHFLFFVFVVVLALYEDWLPFLLALAVVVLHHAIVGVLAPGSVYSTPDAIAHPVRYALVHGGFVAAAGVAAIVGWRLNEDVREKALRSQERFRRSFDDAPIGMVLASRDGTWLEVNRALCRMLGRPPAELLGGDTASVVLADGRAGWQRMVDGLGDGESGAIAFEPSLLHRDGRVLAGSVHASAMADGSIVVQVEDVTERRRAEQAAQRRMAQQRHLAAFARLGLESTSLPVLFAEATEHVRRGLGVSHAEVVALDRDAAPAEDAGDRLPVDGARALAAAAAGAGMPFVVESVDGEVRFDASPLAAAGLACGIAAPIQRAHGEAFGVLAAFAADRRSFSPEDVYFVRSIAAVIGGALRQRDTDEDLRHQSLHDALTGLPNRVLFDDRLKHALARAQRSGTQVAAMFVDLDDFKLVNDGFGHQAGDRLLQTMATRIAACLRPNDTLARFGGDEFVILCEDLTSDEDAVVVAERIRAALDAPCDVDEHQHFVTASIGLATSTPAYFGRPEHLVRDADAAMYRAKAEGRNRVETFDDTMRERVLRRVEVERDLRRAIDAGELTLVYQPLLHLSDGRVAKCEALVRWSHPVKGMLSPAEFVPIAEQSGLILRLGAWVIEEVCRQVAAWRRSEIPALRDMRVALNLSAVQVGHERLPDEIAEALARHGVPAEQIVCEITETALIADPESATRTLGALEALGIEVALDDFGTGYSSLASLKQYPLSTIKLDRSFISEMAPGNRDEAIIASVVQMAHSMSLTTVAEGIETLEQRDALVRLGCDIGQGYLFSRPLGVADLEAIVASADAPVA